MTNTENMGCSENRKFLEVPGRRDADSVLVIFLFLGLLSFILLLSRECSEILCIVKIQSIRENYFVNATSQTLLNPWCNRIRSWTTGNMTWFDLDTVLLFLQDKIVIVYGINLSYLGLSFAFGFEVGASAGRGGAYVQPQDLGG